MRVDAESVISVLIAFEWQKDAADVGRRRDGERGVAVPGGGHASERVEAKSGLENYAFSMKNTMNEPNSGKVGGPI